MSGGSSFCNHEFLNNVQSSFVNSAIIEISSYNVMSVSIQENLQVSKLNPVRLERYSVQPHLQVSTLTPARLERHNPHRLFCSKLQTNFSVLYTMLLSCQTLYVTLALRQLMCVFWNTHLHHSAQMSYLYVLPVKQAQVFNQPIFITGMQVLAVNTF